MSGTPMNNRAYELYTVMNQISPIDFPNKQIFYSEYCGMTYDPSQFGGYNLIVMLLILKDYIIKYHLMCLELEKWMF